MWRGLIPVVFIANLVPATAQVDSTAMRYASTITETDLRAHLTILASDAYEGRETGMKGQKMAATYIEEQFQKFGIPPVRDAKQHGMLADGYQQQYPLILSKPGGLSLAVDGKEYGYMQDYFYNDERLRKDLEAPDVMLATPVSLGGMRLGGGSKVVMLLDVSKSDNDQVTDIQALIGTLDKTGTQVLLLVNDSAKHMMKHFGPLLDRERMRLAEPSENVTSKGLQVLMITPELAQAILDKGHYSMKQAVKTVNKKRVIIQVPIKFTYRSRDKQLTGENVLGYVEGSDLKGQLVAVTAHYDHIGVIDGEVYNGADDDGSGTVAVLEMAEAFAKAKAEGHGPRRSMLFMTVSGEEKGLLGSQWYTDHPVFPLDSTVADLNTDMIGRTDTVHGDSSSYVYVIGSKRISRELGALIERENAAWTKLDLDYTFDSDTDPNRFYYRSDHYNFAKHGVPIAFFFNGVHADYHGPYDEVDKIRFDLLRRRTLLVFHTAWDLANSDARIVVDHPVVKGE